MSRLDLGYFVRPAAEVGGPLPRVEPVLAYLVRRPEGLLLFDTGMGAADPETEAHYRPVRRPLAGALAAVGVAVDDVSVVVNCHLHFDHCGGNPLFAGRPILVQATELATARAGDYTFPELVDFAGVSYREVDGEAEIWPGVRVVPTPGHTAGHQSLVVREPDGTVVLAGQAHDFASQFGSDELARRAGRDGVAAPLPDYRRWVDRLLEFDPRRVVFAHDGAVWEPSGS
ncbi:MBL fold metallo-hydrolase [Polymorphospora sp. NPDC050346]|uniref:MBL fold metallo-hydrolase n=1 Tax=Polymorphospora sp. NPDC050346 TaxID=3155780 RepID=UPI0033E24C09